MIHALFQRGAISEPVRMRARWLLHWGLLALTLAATLIIVALGLHFQRAPLDAPLLVESTPGQLAIWVAEQSGEDAPESVLAQLVKNLAVQQEQERAEPATLLNTARNGMVVFLWIGAANGIVGLAGLARTARWSRTALMVMLVGVDALVFMIPVVEGDSTLSAVLFTIFLLLVILLFSPGPVTRVLGFLVVLSTLLLTWELFKAFSASVDYKIGLPQTDWTYRTYATLEESLAALEEGEIAAVVVDSKNLRDVMATYPEEQGSTAASGLPYPNLRLLSNIEKDTSILILPIVPEFPGRLGVAVRASDASTWRSVSELLGEALGTVAGEFADEKFLALPRRLVLIDLRIGNDLNMPHLQSVAEALFQPARRNGPVLLLRILASNSLFTWSEAVVGFVSGALLGFVLGTLFAHSRLMERGLLPYVVASQTVPILAFAPMVVIWLGASWMAVAVISAYLTFFPVTINTMRGLQSPHPNAVELMRSYAASRWTIMWKLRFPAALPYIFTALKVSATASVVGAIIGELPSGIRDGLGGAILNFNQYYVSDPAKLWAAILVAASVGIFFFVIISVLERIALRRHMQGA